MVELDVQEELWNDFAAAAERQGVPPQRAVEELLRDFVARAADEQLLARSEQAARRARFRAADSEALIGQYRHRRE